MAIKNAEFAETVARNIRVGRAAQRLSQEKLANVCGVTNKTVSKWETADYGISFEHAARVADALGIELEDLRKEA